MWKTLPPRWRFRAPRTQVSGAVPCRRTVTPPTWPTAGVRRPTGAVHWWVHIARPSQGFPRPSRVLQSPLPGALPGAHTRARQPQPHKDPCPRGPGWVCGLLCPPGTAAGVPHRDVAPVRSPGERWRPELTGAGVRPPSDARCYPPLWESRRLRDLERDLEDAQATCQALSSEQNHRLQELQRVRADLHRSEGDLASIRRDHATVSGELVRQRARTRALEEEGSSLRRQLADAQRAARDVAGAVDERLSRHLPAILEAVQIVPDEHISQPAVERALRGWVPAGSGPPSTANPNFREICATLVCAAVLRVDPPPSLEQLSRRLRVPVQPVLHFPTEAVGQGPQLGLPTNARPKGRGPNATRRARGLPSGPHGRPAQRRGHPREPLRGGNHPHRHGCGRGCNLHTGAGRAPRPLGVPKRGTAGLADGGGP